MKLFCIMAWMIYWGSANRNFWVRYRSQAVCQDVCWSVFFSSEKYCDANYCYSFQVIADKLGPTINMGCLQLNVKTFNVMFYGFNRVIGLEKNPNLMVVWKLNLEHTWLLLRPLQILTVSNVIATPALQESFAVLV